MKCFFLVESIHPPTPSTIHTSIIIMEFIQQESVAPPVESLIEVGRQWLASESTSAWLFSEIEETTPLFAGIRPLSLSKAWATPKHDFYGPLGESNWVIKPVVNGFAGGLIAGCMPGSRKDTQHYTELIDILKTGVNHFACLQAEYDPAATRADWMLGKKKRPYFNDILEMLRDKESTSDLQHLHLTAETVKWTHCPIPDMDIGEDAVIKETALKLADAIRGGDVIYLHCWGGHGRTGTLVCIILCILYEYLSVDNALNYCQYVHDQRESSINGVKSPQLTSQVDQVKRIVKEIREP